MASGPRYKDFGDGAIQGLTWQFNKKGRRVYSLYYVTTEGVRRRPKIGTEDQVSLEEARKIAREWWAHVVRGGDPSGERRLKSHEQTMFELFVSAMKEHYNSARFINSGHRAEVARLWENDLAKTFGDLKISSVTTPMIYKWHMKYTSKPYVGNRAKSLLSKLFRLAQLKGLIPPGSNPAVPVPNHKEESRDRHATPEEIQKLVGILNATFIKKPREAAFIWLMLLTGSRPSLFERSKWKDVTYVERNGQRVGLLTQQGKAGMDVVVIPPSALRILSVLPQDPESSIVGTDFPRPLWVSIKRRAGIVGLRAIDLRRTFASTGMSNGLGMDQIGKTLNHRDRATTEIYARMDQGAKIDTALTIADLLNDVILNARPTVA